MFTPAEDAKLLLLVDEHGTKWSTIQKKGFPNRSTLQIKNRYYSKLKKLLNPNDQDEPKKAALLSHKAPPVKQKDNFDNCAD